MSTSQKAVIVVLAVIVALFVGSMLLQNKAGDGDASETTNRDSLLKSFADQFASTSDADRADVSGECLQSDGSMLFQGSCALKVAQSDSTLRLVRLRAVEGPTTISAPGPEGADVTITKTLGGDDQVSIAVDKKGSTINLSCPVIDTCALKLMNG